MNILVPTADYPPIEGGIATVTLQLSRELAALGHDVTVVAPHFSGQSDFDDAESAKVIRYRGYGMGWFRLFPMLAATLPRARKADLVLGINIAYGGLIGLLARKIFGVPYVTFGYAYEFLKFKRNPVIAALLLRAYRRSALTVAISGFTRSSLEEFGVPADRIVTILPGAPRIAPADPKRIEELKSKYDLDGRRVILAVGRMIPRKGQATLVRALPRILESHADVVLLCTGRGPSQNEVAGLADQLDVKPNLRLPGYVSDEDLAALYALCEIFALPTGEDARGQVEGFGLVFAEAHAHCKPVVAGRSGGVVDAVIDGETGLLVPPGDPDALAEAILSLLDDPEKAKRFGQAGRARVERELNWGHFTRTLVDTFEARR